MVNTSLLHLRTAVARQVKVRGRGRQNGKQTKECFVWSTQQPSRAHYLDASYIILNKPEVNSSCRYTINSLDAWRLFFTVELILPSFFVQMRALTKHGKILEAQKACWKDSSLKEANATNIKTFVGQWYIRSLLKLTCQNATRIFRIYGNAMFCATVPFNWLKNLSAHPKLDD